jgi:hypothetical protein
MLTSHQNALISLLLGSFPNFQSGDSAAALAAYDIVMTAADERDLQPGFMLLIEGMYASHDGRFAPTSAQLAGAIRVMRDRRLDAERLDKLRRPVLPPPDIVHTPEERGRVKAKLDAGIEKLARILRTDEAAAEMRRTSNWDKVNTRFKPDREERAMGKRLGFSSGDPDGDQDAA